MTDPLFSFILLEVPRDYTPSRQATLSICYNNQLFSLPITTSYILFHNRIFYEYKDPIGWIQVYYNSNDLTKSYYRVLRHNTADLDIRVDYDNRYFQIKVVE